MMSAPEKLLLAIAILFHAAAGHAANSWKPAAGPLMTRWARDVKADKALPEYPRPQMVREKWQNLNGLWDYAITEKDAAQATQWDGKILVPFPIESALSGVMKMVGEDKRLWYRRTFKVPSSWKNQRVLLHFGAVDWDARVWVNGKELGAHRGGYDGFSFDITGALHPSGDQEIVVSVWDPTDAGYQPRGKQVRKPGGIWYTPTTGIWQTVWIEPVSEGHIIGLKLTPNIDNESVSLEAMIRPGADSNEITVEVLDGRKTIQTATLNQVGPARDGTAARLSAELKVPNPKLWTPDTPFLYGLKIALKSGGKKSDAVESYFGMRKISRAKDSDGIQRLLLNNKAVFQFGPLDQGFWPDGIYTAPTDEALRYDIEMTKKLGFNMARKHVKVEPERWYYWCDKLGLLVWQDMPSGDRYINNRAPDITRSPESAAEFETELKALINGRYNHPCIVMWVPYNEGWGQWDTARIVDLVRKTDPTRLVNNASGWTDRRVGDVIDMHNYPGPGVPRLEENRAAVLGEFGGLGLPLSGHTWQAERNWGYRSYKNSAELTDAYVALIDKLHPLTGQAGLCAAVYTQTTDCEVEVNGLMTYDRALVKMDAAAITAANKKIYTPLPPRRHEAGKLVPPATPLVANDPYFSIWSPADKLNEVDTTHWTGRRHAIRSVLRIDGESYRVVGAGSPREKLMEQKSLDVLPTRTIYTFEGGGVALTLTFMTPALPDDLDVLSRPVTYVSYDLRSTDGKNHNVAIGLGAFGEIAVNDPSQMVVVSSPNIGESLRAARIGSRDQPVLAKKGDDLRIDWGYLYVAAPAAQQPRIDLLPDATKAEEAVRAEDARAQIQFSDVKVTKEPVTRWLMLAYDDLYSIQYMRQNLRPYWRRNGWEAGDLLQASAREYSSLQKRCAAFDEELMNDLRRAGGDNYAKLCALAYRQCFAAGKFVADADGKPLQFCKENHSNGCIGTSDVFYPMAPQFLLFGPTLAKSFVVPFMNYAASDRWRFPFAPHDLGTYPKANGQVYGDGERGVNNQMPVEESGNLLLLITAIAEMEGNADFAGLYWKQLDQWAQYLKEKGFDPENQLCTDDFAGHLAHNVNLSAKAICGLGAFGKLCQMRGESAKGDEYLKLAREFAQRWVREADDGDHFRLAFDKPGTWSQKYNLIWDRILGLNLFPADVLRKEMDYYKKIQNKYGLPLDNRQGYTKLDWITWTASLTQNQADFAALIDPIIVFLNETPDRSPMTDWYQTKTAKKVGFTARPVVGGVFAQMLYDKQTWKKYAGRDQTKASGWAPMPKPPTVVTVVPTAQNQAIEWHYTTERPGNDWFTMSFDDRSWKTGNAGFGTRGTPGSVVRTEWNTPNIWIRREFTLPEGQFKDLQLYAHHDEDVEVYINGIPAATATGFVSSYEELPMTSTSKAALKPGRNTIAVHCHQTTGGQYIDVGLAEVK